MLKLLKEKEKKKNEGQEKKGKEKDTINNSCLLRGSRENGIGNEHKDFGNFDGILVLGLGGSFIGFLFCCELHSLYIYTAQFPLYELSIIIQYKQSKIMQNEFTFIFPTISIIDPSCISDKPKETIENTF